MKSLATIHDIRAVLSRTPATLGALLDGLDPALARAPYGPGTWSAHEVIAHLIFGERTDWLPRLRHILAHGDAAPFAPFDRAGHADLASGHSLPELLDLFAAERSSGLAALNALRLTEADLARAGLHPALGPVTVCHLLHTWAAHDLNHIAQVCKAVAFQFGDGTGPWCAYLSILSPPNPR